MLFCRELENFVIYDVLSQIRKCLNLRFFGANFLGPNLYLCYSTRFFHLCTCLTFLRCAFSNDSSNSVPEKRHNRIGCICLNFLHCAFSDVSSNCTSQKRLSHSGYICLAFLLCAFSNVASNCLSQKRHSCIGCICLAFSTHVW